MGVEIREWMNWARHRKLAATLLAIVTLGIGIVIGTLISDRVAASREQTENGAAPLAVPSPVQLSGTFATIATRLEPAVVNISTTQVVEQRRTPRRRGFPPGQDPFQDFFDRFFDPQDRPERSLGSGVIVDKRGYILTNNHVVDQADRIQVKLKDYPTAYNGKVIGADPLTDLAVIKIEVGRDLPTARLGNSDAVQVGDWVLAFGSPFGLEATVTAGIVSAKDRANLRGSQQFQRFIQTDAAINPGNSGGPLVNMAGEIIGINTAIVTSSRGYDGVGFAMPSNVAINVYNQLVSSGKVTRGSIGISFNEEHSRNPVLLKHLGATHGIYIEQVAPGSPAEKAGLQTDDLITHINGNAVKSGSDLVDPISTTPVGEKVRITYLRDRQQKEVTLTVADRKVLFPKEAGASAQVPGEPEASQFGLRVEPLTPELARRLGMEAESGVVVVEVEAASFAEDIGFLRGDLLVEVNQQPVTSLADYRRLVDKLKPSQEVIFKVRRRADDRVLSVPLAGVVPPAQ